jgi:hypothetical protein
MDPVGAVLPFRKLTVGSSMLRPNRKPGKRWCDLWSAQANRAAKEQHSLNIPRVRQYVKRGDLSPDRTVTASRKEPLRRVGYRGGSGTDRTRATQQVRTALAPLVRPWTRVGVRAQATASFPLRPRGCPATQSATTPPGPAARSPLAGPGARLCPVRRGPYPPWWLTMVWPLIVVSPRSAA